MTLKYFHDLLQINEENDWVDSNIVISGYNLFVKNKKTNDKENVIEVAITQKRGLYKCEDDIFCFKKVNEIQYEFWDYMDYVERRIDIEENIIPRFFRAINKISSMHKILQKHHLNKPKLIDSDELLFTLKLSRRCPIKYNQETERILLGFYSKHDCEHL